MTYPCLYRDKRVLLCDVYCQSCLSVCRVLVLVFRRLTFGALGKVEMKMLAVMKERGVLV